MTKISVHSTVTPATGGPMTATGTTDVGGTFSTTLTLEDGSKSDDTTLTPDGKKLQFLFVWMTSEDPENTTVDLSLSTHDDKKSIKFDLDAPLILAGNSVAAFMDDRVKLKADLTSGASAQVMVLAGREA